MKSNEQCGEELNVAGLNARLLGNYLVGKRTLMFLALVAAVGFAVAATAGTGEALAQVSQPAIPELAKAKQTVLGLYVTAKEA